MKHRRRGPPSRLPPMPRAALACLCLALWTGCGRPEPEPEPPPAAWAGEPPGAWPEVVLTNRFQVDTQFRDGRGGAFLVDTGDDTLAVAAKHLLLPLRSQRLQAVDFSGLTWYWTVYRRTAPADSARVSRLVNADPEEELVRAYVVNRDWLVFDLAEAPPGVEPLRPRYTAVTTGERVWLIGWDASGNQKVVAGEVESTHPYTYLTDFSTADVTAMSGAPVVDARGLLVGLHSGTLGQLSWVNSTRYLREILAGLAVTAGTRPATRYPP